MLLLVLTADIYISQLWCCSDNFSCLDLWRDLCSKDL